MFLPRNKHRNRVRNRLSDCYPLAIFGMSDVAEVAQNGLKMAQTGMQMCTVVYRLMVDFAETAKTRIVYGTEGRT